MLLCAANPGKVGALSEWLASQTLKGTELQDAATKSGFEPSFVALVLFPQVVTTMAKDLDWTTRLGQAFTADRSAVFASIQRLRVQAQNAGHLKSTPQQDVEARTTSSGQQVVVIEPANPQVVYVPQYNPQTVYTDVHGGRAGAKQRQCGRRRNHRIHGRHRHWRGDRQRLLLRTPRLARRRLHVRRRVGRLQRRARRCARRLAGPPRGSRRRAWRPCGATRRNSARTGSNPPSSSAPRPSRRGSRRIRRHRRSATRGARKRRLRRADQGERAPARKRAATAGNPDQATRDGAARNPMRFPATRAESRNAPPVQRGQRSRSSSRGGGRGGRRR